MRLLRVGPPLLAGLALIAGCGSSDPTPSGEASKQPLVTYTKSGGIAGIYERVTVEPDGTTTVADGLPSRAKTKTITLTANQVLLLRRVLSAADLAAHEHSATPACADCFVYEITYGGTTFKGEQAALPQRAVPAVQALDQVLARAGIEEPLATGK